MAKESFKELEEDIIEFFNSRIINFNIPIVLDFVFLSNSKQKNHLIKLVKLSDPYSVALNKDILVIINSEYFDAFDDDTKTILFDQEIDKIEFDLEKGTFKIGKANFSSNRGIIEKYTYKQVQRAVEIEKLYEQQKKDEQQNK